MMQRALELVRHPVQPQPVQCLFCTRAGQPGRDPGAQASRFIAEMALDANTVKEDPRAKPKELRAECAKNALDAVAVNLAADSR